MRGIMALLRFTGGGCCFPSHGKSMQAIGGRLRWETSVMDEFVVPLGEVVHLGRR